MSDEREALARTIYIADNWRYADGAALWQGEAVDQRKPYYVMADSLIVAGYVKATP